MWGDTGGVEKILRDVQHGVHDIVTSSSIVMNDGRSYRFKQESGATSICG